MGGEFFLVKSPWDGGARTGSIVGVRRARRSGLEKSGGKMVLGRRGSGWVVQKMPLGGCRRKDGLKLTIRPWGG